MNQLYFAQKAFIVHEGSLLLVRKSMDDPNQPGKWEVPGGRMAFGEEIDEHLSREVREEVGLEITAGPPFHLWQWRISRVGKDGEPLNLQIVAVGRLCRPETLHISYDGRVEEDYLAETAWVRLDQIYDYNLIDNMVPAVDAFLAYVAKRKHEFAE